MENDHLVEPKHPFLGSALPAAYTEAIPNALSILDVLKADTSGFDFANQWVTSLLRNGTTSFSIQPDEEASRNIAHLYFSAHNSERVKGYKNLGFGYPILAKKDGQAKLGLLVAPIFIWSLQIEPNPLKANHWQFSIPKPKSVRVNPIIAGLTPETTELVQQFQKKYTNKGITLKIVTQFCSALSALLDYQNDQPNFDIVPFPDIVDLATMEKTGAIVWSGILAAFPPIHLYSLADSILSKDYWQSNLLRERKEVIQFAYLNCDHQQKAAHIAGQKNKFILVEGAAGSGKKHAICNALINNLLNKERSLVIGKSVVELEKLASVLVEAGFGDLLFLFKNLNLDKDNLIDGLTAKTTKTATPKNGLFKDFIKDYKYFDKTRTTLEQAVSAYSTNVFDINNWTETVGLYLKNSRSEGKEFLDTQLQVNDFSFDFMEYEIIKEKIRESEEIFQEAFSFFHPLDELTNTCFQNQNKKEAKLDLEAKLTKLLKKTRKVQKDYFLKVGLYKSALEDHYEQHFQNLKEKVQTTKDAIDQLQLQFGSEYHKTSVGNLKFLKTFSGKSKTALKLKSNLLKQFESLQNLFAQQTSFDFIFSEAASLGDIEELDTQLTEFDHQLDGWRLQSQIEIQDNVRRLNSKTAYSGIKYTQQIADLEQAVEALVTEVNESKLFKIGFKNNAMTLQLKQQLLDELIEKLSSSIHNLRDFDAFYSWRQLGATLSEKEQKVIKALIKVRPQNWLVAFDAWYFHNLLTKESKQNANLQPLLDSFLHQIEGLRAKVPTYLESIWQTEKVASIAKLKKAGRSQFTSFLKKSKDTKAFANYFSKNLAKITRFFPIILMTNEMAKVLLPGALKDKFDTIIIKEGATLTKEEGGSLLSLAHKVQVYGVGKEGNRLTHNSFWDLAKTLAGKHILLKTLHRKKALPLYAFNNAAFDQQMMVSLNGQVETGSLEIHSLDGDYSESLRTNDTECRYLLSLLTNLKGTPQHTYPKVGFVCATVEQRNLFASYLLSIKQNRTNGAEKIKHLERNGLSIYSFDELQGQKFDILFISFVFSSVNVQGDITKDMDYLNSLNGEKILQQVLNSSIQKIVFCHSLPNEFTNNFKHERKHHGWYILANLIAYGKAIATQDNNEMHKIINGLSKKIVAPKLEDKAVFLNQVGHYLSAYFEPDRILANQEVGQQIFPLMIKGKGKKPKNYIIQADRFSYNTDTFSFLWQEQAYRNLAEKGYIFLPIWSRDWWRHPEEEARKLASKIIQAEGE